jgi:multidrug efflux system outer membrane protein
MSVIRALAALSLFFIFALAGCTAQRSVTLTEPPVPAQWLQVENTRPVDMRWLAALNTPQVEAITRRAIASNHALAQQAAQVEVARQQVILSGADRWPALSIGGGGQRGRATAVSAVRESYDIGIFAAFELDLWGKLSDSQRQAQLQFAAQELCYRRAERTLVVRGNLIRWI